MRLSQPIVAASWTGVSNFPSLVSGLIPGGLARCEDHIAVARCDAQRGPVVSILRESQDSGLETLIEFETGLAPIPDNHLYLELEFESVGLLHVIGWAHASKIFYRLIEYSSLGIEVKLDENSMPMPIDLATYPMFFRSKKGLGLTLRNGVPGDGSQVFLLFHPEDRAWRQTGQKLDGLLVSSPYVSRPISSQTSGLSDFVSVWRLSPASNSNFRVTAHSFPTADDTSKLTETWEHHMRLPMSLGAGIMNGAVKSLVFTDQTQFVCLYTSDIGRQMLGLFSPLADGFELIQSIDLGPCREEVATGTLVHDYAISTPMTVDDDTYFICLRSQDEVVYLEFRKEGFRRLSSSSLSAGFETNNTQFKSSLVGDLLLEAETRGRLRSFYQLAWSGDELLEDGAFGGVDQESKCELRLVRLEFRVENEPDYSNEAPLIKKGKHQGPRFSRELDEILEVLLRRLSANVRARLDISKRLTKAESTVAQEKRNAELARQELASCAELMLHTVGAARNLETNISSLGKGAN